MKRRLASKSRVFIPRKVSPDRELVVRILRLMVLYEDLRIELHELDALPPPQSPWSDDSTMKRIWHSYFIRRSLASIHEFSDCLSEISRQHRDEMLRRLDPEDFSMFQDAVRYFERENRDIRKIRNHVGGHFGYKAARIAAGSEWDRVAGSVELSNQGDNPAPIRLKAAFAIQAVAALSQVSGDSPTERASNLEQLLKECYTHAVNSVHALLVPFLWHD